jgi:hypothetical protein
MKNIKIRLKYCIFLHEPIIIDFDFIVFITISLLVPHSCTFSISSFNLMLISDMELDKKCNIIGILDPVHTKSI